MTEPSPIRNFGACAQPRGSLSPEVARAVRVDGLSAPITVTWEITSRCNLRCTHCLSASGPDVDTARELSLDQARGVVDQLAAEKVFQIHFGGGEPFLFPGFMELLRHAQARGFCCLCISTNGALLDEARVRELDALGGIYLQLSLDGATEATCDAIRGRGAYRKVLEALERLRSTVIVRTLNFVYTRANAGELDAMAALAEAKGATLRVTRLKPSGRGAERYAALRPTQAQLAHLHGWLHAHPEVLTGDSFFHLNAFGGAALPGFQSCGAARLTCLITPEGGVYPCAFTQTPFFQAGSLRERSFGQIWRESPVFQRVFRRPGASSGGGACTRCEAYEGCGGGCPAVKHSLTGRLDLPDPDCVLDTARLTPSLRQPLCAD
ncbi:MAG: mycofactocin radical SAM maturase [Deltaproteobacteria bacterium]|nr:mycofactocin radical SAM maturase [Deltaproteobacteria bacterium]